jgi:3-hydroxyacyl-CoA dehydrogenase
MSLVAIIGSGLIGRAWANVFARAGWEVRVWDPDAAVRSAAPGLVAESLHDFQENGPERLDVKKDVFARLDAATRADAILASSTSAIVASKFTEELTGRGRCLVAHPVNPPHVVPIVELCGAPWTTHETKARAREIYASVGQVPIDVKKEIDGFILNRLQIALLTEAFRLVQEGYVSPRDLDHTIADGLGLRWAFMGPFETIELNAPSGIADYCRRYGDWFRRYMQDLPSPSVWADGEWQKAADAWGPAADPAFVAEKSRWRNERLAALAAHKKAEKSFTG